MKQFFELVTVIPVGPNCRQEYIIDTINSLLFYTINPVKIILVDDSQKQTGAAIKKVFNDVDVIVSNKNMGKFCGLYINLSNAFQHAIKNYSFKALLRMDTDALIINREPAKEAIELFDKHPHIGIAGQYPNDYNEQLWDKGWPVFQLSRFTHVLKQFKNPLVNIPLRKYYKRAAANGYIMGESVFGGACFYNELCLKKLSAAGLLPLKILRKLVLEEDHLFAILAKSLNMHFGNLASDGLPFACAWKDLPDSPGNLYNKGKKIIHSTRCYKQMNEAQIRSFFRDKRQQVSSTQNFYETILQYNNSDAGRSEFFN